MASLIGMQVTLFDGRKGIILSVQFGNPDPRYGSVQAAGQPTFNIQLEDMSVIKNVPLSVISKTT